MYPRRCNTINHEQKSLRTARSYRPSCLTLSRNLSQPIVSGGVSLHCPLSLSREVGVVAGGGGELVYIKRLVEIQWRSSLYILLSSSPLLTA